MESISESGSVSINGKKYKYKFFDTTELINLIRHDKKFTDALELAIQTYRNNQAFKIKDLVSEYIYYRPDDITTYYIIYTKNVIVSTVRFYYNLDKKTAYFNMVYTNPEYRGQKICQTNIEHLISITKDKIKKYELEVDVNNPAAIKCYVNVGFKKVKEVNLGADNIYYLMRLKV